MSLSFFRPNTAENVVFDGVYADLEQSTLNVSDGKYLKVNAGSLEWATPNTANNVVKTDSNNLIPSSLIPAHFDDLRMYANLASFPAIGDSTQGIIYIAEDTGYNYKWDGTAYINISTLNFYNKVQTDTLLNAKLNLAGGTLTGDVNLGGKAMSNGFSLDASSILTSDLRARNNTSILTTPNSGDCVIGRNLNMNNLDINNCYLGNFGGVKTGAIADSNGVNKIVLNAGGTMYLDQNLNANAKNITGATIFDTADMRTSLISARDGTQIFSIPNGSDAYLQRNLFCNNKELTGCLDIQTSEVRTQANQQRIGLPTSGDILIYQSINMNGRNIDSANNIICNNFISTNTFNSNFARQLGAFYTTVLCAIIPFSMANNGNQLVSWNYAGWNFNRVCISHITATGDEFSGAGETSPLTVNTWTVENSPQDVNVFVNTAGFTGTARIYIHFLPLIN